MRKLFHWLPDGTLQLRIDWSSIESFLGCNRLAEFKLVWAKTTAPKSALVFGAAMHAALEIWYRNRHRIGTRVLEDLSEVPYEEKDSGLAEELTEPFLLQRCLIAIETTYSEYPIGFITDHRTSDFCTRCFFAYIEYYKTESLVPISHEGKAMVEFSFSYPLGKIEIPTSVFEAWGWGQLSNDAEKEQAVSVVPYQVTEENNFKPTTIPCSIEWTGIIDLLARMGDELWLADHKTTSVLSSDFFDVFEIAMQPVGYVTAVRAAFPDLDIKGFLVNVLACRKPTAALTPSGKKSTAKAFEPHRRLYAYEKWKEEEFKTDTLALIEEFIANLTSKYFPRKTQWCSGKYGKCGFFEVCSLPPEQRMMMLNGGNYVDNTWKPVK